MSRRYRPFDPFERGGPFDAGREIRLPQIPRRFWGGVALFLLAILVFIAASPIVSFITELQWYDSLGYRDVYTTRLVLGWSLFAVGFLRSFAYLLVNVAIALRARSGAAPRAVGIRRTVFRGPAGWISLATAAIISVILGAGAFSQWQALALYLHATPTGTTDPVLGQAISFYLLTLPFLHAAANWTLGLDFLTSLLGGALYSWRGDSFDFRPTPRAIAHVSVLIAAFAVTLAATTWLGRYDLLSAHNSNVVWGAAYTDVNARLPLYSFQSGAGIVLAGALVANVWVRRLWLPAGAIGLWVLLTIVSQAYPAVVQGVSATPNAQSYELPYIQREIAGTRAAYGLSNVAVGSFTGDQPLTAQDVQSDQATVNNLRLWDYTQLKETYQQQQTLRTYYTFNDIDIDRYTVNGQFQQLEISSREIDTARLSSQAQNWVNIHRQYTHGYGAAASPVNSADPEGLPNHVVGDLPPSGALTISQPAIYFGELTNDYVLAPSNTREFDYPQGSQDVFTNYSGQHGVPMTGVNRALWSLKLSDFNLLVSGQVSDKTYMLYRRNIKDRASELAPFLTFDHDPYLVVADGKLYWILDAYTSASSYPYSQTMPFGDNYVNYIRNSVKVVVNAYDGTTSFYVIDSKDPLIKAYEATFPAMFKPIDAMPPALRAHLRVPEDLFNAQVQVYATYHVSADAAGAKVLFAREDVWAVPIGNSFLYFEPIYLRAKQESSLPELKRVILADQDHVAYATTLDQAVQQLVGNAPPPTTTQPPPTTYTAAQVAQIQSLIDQANQHYKAAYAALARGDFTTFATEMQTVGQILQQLQTLTGTSSTPPAGASPSPKASPSP